MLSGSSTGKIYDRNLGVGNTVLLCGVTVASSGDVGLQSGDGPVAVGREWCVEEGRLYVHCDHAVSVNDR